MDEGSRFICGSKSIVPADEVAGEMLEAYETFQAPFFSAKKNVYLHDLLPDSCGTSYVGRRTVEELYQ